MPSRAVTREPVLAEVRVPLLVRKICVRLSLNSTIVRAQFLSVGPRPASVSSEVYPVSFFLDKVLSCLLTYTSSYIGLRWSVSATRNICLCQLIYVRSIHIWFCCYLVWIALQFSHQIWLLARHSCTRVIHKQTLWESSWNWLPSRACIRGRLSGIWRSARFPTSIMLSAVL